MIPKTRPYLEADELLAALSFGTAQEQFETVMANRAKARFGVAFSYAHAAFYALMKTMNLESAEIILPAYTCEIMSEVVLQTGNIPVFVDIDLADFNMNLNTLKEALTSKTRAIIATHMFGYPTDVNAIRQLTGGNDKIMIIEDSALRFPDSNGVRGDVGLFSFGPGKPLFTIRGGIIVTNDVVLYDKLRDYRGQYMSQIPPKEWAKRWAQLLAAYLFKSNSLYGLALRLGIIRNSFERSATSIPADYATAYADFQARMGTIQIKRADELLAKRHTVVSLYNCKLQNITGFTPAPVMEGAVYSYYTTRVKNRDALQFSQEMYRLGIQTGRTYDYSIPNFKKYRPYVKRRFPQAQQAAQEVVNLPFYENLSETEIDFVADNVRQILLESN